ncbi:MAG: hemolysin family protein [Candidatus Calescibacterium sp.]|nr:hemolysin family protein [Candidatus Calescibacterium sp.]MCX7733938.1 hemolysin family protein [bacterium]MDW8086464.1 hemolysin family protein [Candidatus Calescibacterium sp.]
MLEGLYILISLTLFLVFASAFLSASEVVYSASRDDLLKNISKNDVIYDIIQHPEKFFSVILILDNFSNIVVTALITYKTMEIFGGWAVPISTILISAVVILFGEIFPKTLAVRYRGELSRFILVVSAYLVKILGLFSSPISKLFSKVAEEEIRRQSYYSYVLPEQAKMVQGIMRLKELELRDILVPRHLAVVLDAEMNISEVISIIEKTKHTRYPVIHEGRVIGILLSKNLLCNLYGFIVARDGSVKLKDIIESNPEVMKPAKFASPSKSLLEQLIDFKKWRTHMVCVIDDFGEFLGIVTLEDIMEEITGDLYDEFIVPTKNFWKENEYIYARGSTPIRDINREFETNMDERFETIASTIISVLGRIPEKGEKVNFDGWEIELLDTSKNKINLVRMKKILL